MSEDKKIQDNAVDISDLDAAIEASKEAEGGYTHKFKKPFLWQGKEYEMMHFDFAGLSGADMIAIEKELALTEGISVVTPTMSGPFLVAMAARASGIGYDAIMAMPIFEANRIRAKARNFLLSSEL